MKTEVMVLNEERNVSLTAYIQGVGGTFGCSVRPAILILPGGAYADCADCEADPVAFAYAKAGYQTFILRYTLVSKGKWPLPLEDYEEAMEIILSHADEWHLAPDKIAVIGFSAGGHLAGCAATVARHRPAAVLLIYAATIKEYADMCQPGMPYPAECVTPDTPPCFLATCRDDPIDVKNTLAFSMALNENGIPFESHIYSFGGHGYATAEPVLCVYPATDRLSHWVADSIGWLDENMGKLTKDGFAGPDPAVQKSADNMPCLSVDCTLSHILKQGQEIRQILSPIFSVLDAAVAEKGGSDEGLAAVMGKSKIRDLLRTIKVPEDEIDRLDETLRSIENKKD